MAWKAAVNRSRSVTFHPAPVEVPALRAAAIAELETLKL
jgi:hypothetical protein